MRSANTPLAAPTAATGAGAGAAAHAQLRLARPLAADLRRPWEKPTEPERLTPARVRRGFRNLRPNLPCPARAPKPDRPGPGRPLGSKNRQPATRYDVGKTVRRPDTIAERDHVRPLRTSQEAVAIPIMESVDRTGVSIG